MTTRYSMQFKGKTIKVGTKVKVNVPTTALSLTPGPAEGVVSKVMSPTYEFALCVGIKGHGIFIRKTEIIEVS